MSLEDYDLTDEEITQIKSVIATIKAGLEQARSEMQMPWTAVTNKRMNTLAEELAMMCVDWTVYDSLLVGTWLAGSSRHQILQKQEGTS